MVAAQLQVQPALWDKYAQTDETRREHLIERLYSFQQFTSRRYREIAQGVSFAKKGFYAAFPKPTQSELFETEAALKKCVLFVAPTAFFCHKGPANIFP